MRKTFSLVNLKFLSFFKFLMSFYLGRKLVATEKAWVSIASSSDGKLKIAAEKGLYSIP